MTDSRPGTPHRTAARYLRMADFAVVPDARHSPDVENPELLLDTLVPTWRNWLRYDYPVRQQPMVA